MSKTLVTYQGEEIALSEAIRRSGSNVAQRTVHHRLKSGWPLARALSLPSSRPSRDRRADGIRPLFSGEQKHG
jgi:hypothetical protein